MSFNRAQGHLGFRIPNKSRSYKFKTDHMRINFKKFYLKNYGADRHYFLVESVFNDGFLTQSRLNQFEQQHVLRHACHSILNMSEFNFKTYFLDPRELAMDKLCFFKKMEVLQGNTIADLFLKDPTKIREALQT